MGEQRHSTDPTPARQDVATALALLTRLPVRADFARSALAVWAFPVAGFCVGLIAAFVGAVATWAGLPPILAATLAITSATICTGAMHEDGLADSADGLWGGFDRERRLEIMRDSHIGTYGVLALILSMTLRITALATLVSSGNLVSAVLAAFVLSRAAIGLPMALLPHARKDGLAVQTGRPPRQLAAFGVGLALAVAWAFLGFVPMVLAATMVAITTFAAARIAMAKLGGQTGDILGATQQLAEIAVLLTLVALA